MAKKKKKNTKKKKSFFKINPKGLLILITVAAAVMIYMAPAILFLLGMLPTIAAYLTDKIPGKNKTLTIGALNFSACFHYLMKIWTHPSPDDTALDYLTNPKTLIIIYLAAVLGYLINYGITILVASVLKQRSETRLNKIEDAKENLTEQWGRKVNGEKPLDAFGFPISSREEF